MVTSVSDRARLRCRHILPSSPNKSTRNLEQLLVCTILLVVFSFLTTVNAVPLTGVPASLSLGWLASLNLPNTNSLIYGHPSFVAYQLAIADINKSPDILPNTTLIGLWADDLSNPSLVVTNAVKYAQTPGVVGIVGDYSSAQTQLVQYAIKPYGLVEITASASSDDFTTFHQTQYPWLAHTCATSKLVAAALTSFIQAMGWQKIAIVNTNDAFGASGAAMHGDMLTAIGVDILVSTSFNQNQQDLTFQMQQLINSKARIIMYWGLAGDLLTLLRYASTLTPNLLGDGYQWLIPQSVAGNTLFASASGGFEEDVFQLTQGLLGVQHHIPLDLPQFQAFYQGWKNAPESTAFNRTLEYATSVNLTNSHITPYAPFTYDTTWLFARALHRVIYELDLDPTLPENFPALYGMVLNTTFIGASGEVALDADGNRRGLEMDVVNIQTATKSFEVVGEIRNGSFIVRQGQTIQWQGPSGLSNSRPLDHQVRSVRVIPTATIIALQVTTSVIITVAFILIVATFFMSSQPVMKASSPYFLILFLFGIMLLASSVYSRTRESQNQFSPGPCLSDLFLCNLGYLLIVGALLVKTIRLRILFLSTKLNAIKSLPDVRLFLWLIGGVFVESMILMALQLSHGMNIELKSYDDTTDYWSCTALGDEDLVKIYLPVTITARFILLVATAVCSWQVRNIPDVFNESKQLLITVYNLLFLSILLPAIDATMGRGKESALIAYSVCVFFICLVSMAIMYVPKFILISQNKEYEPDKHFEIDLSSVLSSSDVTRQHLHANKILVQQSHTGSPPMMSHHSSTAVSPDSPMTGRDRLPSLPQAPLAQDDHSHSLGVSHPVTQAGTATRKVTLITWSKPIGATKRLVKLHQSISSGRPTNIITRRLPLAPPPSTLTAEVKLTHSSKSTMQQTPAVSVSTLSTIEPSGVTIHLAASSSSPLNQSAVTFLGESIHCPSSTGSPVSSDSSLTLPPMMNPLTNPPTPSPSPVAILSPLSMSVLSDHLDQSQSWLVFKQSSEELNQFLEWKKMKSQPPSALSNLSN